ncbi:MAG: UvrD-helicase domain-containing protein [Verrucomicrobiaceae bacterium]|nr:UvrD-helicase domain-containing protein [Verrucomicrobiaceae bacterium]
MDFRIADTFTDSLSRLTGDEQKAVKTTAFDLQMNPASPGMSFHKLDKAKDKNFWSVRVNADIRIIVHKTAGSLLLCYVNHHDKAYDWAERRKLETHPKTGAAQLVEIRETVQQILVPQYVAEEPKKAAKPTKPLFAHLSKEELLSYGVPPEWLKDVRGATEDSYLALADHLPSEAAEALLEIATGGKPRKTEPVEPSTNPFDHPDAQRRFRVMTNVEELERALDAPWEKWTVFLHPEQKQWVARDYSGPARVAGSAGTGKTVVALHRAVHLVRANPDSRVLLTTFSDTLANALRTKFRHLLWNEPRLGERIDIHSFNAIGQRLHKTHCGPAKLASRTLVRDLIKEASKEVGNHKFTQHFLFTEWEQIVDAWQLANWADYRDVARLGRKTRLPEAQRAVLWAIFEKVKAALAEKKLLTLATVFTELAQSLTASKKRPFDFVVVDEAQDVGVPHLRFFAALASGSPNGLFFAGDLGQRIFQLPFSWKSLGVDVRGRSRTLRVNYRTSHQIRMAADRLLGPEVADVDGNIENRSDTISVFNGPAPKVQTFKTEAKEQKAVASWLKEQTKAGLQPHELGVFVRSGAQIDRAKAACESAGLTYRVLDEHVETESDYVSICTMHLAKGLEFRAVAVMACDDEIIPLQERIETVGDDSDLQEVYDTERQLLYVACTRARDRLLITSVEPASEFLDDLAE